MVTKINNGSPGVASFEEGDTYSQVELLHGDTPALGNSKDYPAAAGIALPLYSVVGLTAGALVLASDTVPAIGVTAVAVSATAPVGSRSVRVNHSGNFNINALNWGPDLNTDAKRLAAGGHTSTLAFGKNKFDPTFTA